MKAVVYYRTRPSEPEASEMALQFQRQAVQQEIGTDRYTLVAEFIEHEGEMGKHGLHTPLPSKLPWLIHMMRETRVYG